MLFKKKAGRHDTTKSLEARQQLNPRVFELDFYTLRETDVNPIADNAKNAGKSIIDARLGDPIAFRLWTYNRYKQLVQEAWDDPKNYGYSAAVGVPELRRLLAHGNVEFGTTGYSLEAKDVFIGSGISGVARGLFSTIINPVNGDEVVIPKWSYIIYLAEAALSGAKVSNVDLDATGIVDLGALKDSINRKTKAVFITTVGNPLGVAMSPKTFGQIVEILNDKEREFNHPIYLITDIIYEGFRAAAPLDPILISKEKGRLGPTIELYSISKLISAPGMRLGWMRVYHNGEAFTNVMREFYGGFSMCRQPSLGPAATASQLALYKLYSEFDIAERRQQFCTFQTDRVRETRKRVHTTLMALSEIPEIVFPKYYYTDNGSVPNPDTLNSFYILFGIDHALCPRGELSQARRMAEYLMETSHSVVLATPGDSFLAHEYRGHKQKQELMRIVALYEDPYRVVESVQKYVDYLKSQV
jgi:aspartate/methionine/tyrosine aminotransferase